MDDLARNFPAKKAWVSQQTGHGYVYGTVSLFDEKPMNEDKVGHNNERNDSKSREDSNWLFGFATPES